MTEKQEYEKELIYHLRSQTGKDNSDARYLRHLLDNFPLYAPLSGKTIQMAKKIVENNKAFEQADFKEEFGEDLEELFLNKKKD